MRVLITGTTGGIGGAVKRTALAAGHKVVEVNRGGFEGRAQRGLPRTRRGTEAEESLRRRARAALREDTDVRRMCRPDGCRSGLGAIAGCLCR